MKSLTSLDHLCKYELYFLIIVMYFLQKIWWIKKNAVIWLIKVGFLIISKEGVINVLRNGEYFREIFYLVKSLGKVKSVTLSLPRKMFFRKLSGKFMTYCLKTFPHMFKINNKISRLLW